MFIFNFWYIIICRYLRYKSKELVRFYAHDFRYREGAKTLYNIILYTGDEQSRSTIYNIIIYIYYSIDRYIYRIGIYNIKSYAIIMCVYNDGVRIKVRPVIILYTVYLLYYIHIMYVYTQ